MDTEKLEKALDISKSIKELEYIIKNYQKDCRTYKSFGTTECFKTIIFKLDMAEEFINIYSEKLKSLNKEFAEL